MAESEEQRGWLGGGEGGRRYGRAVERQGWVEGWWRGSVENQRNRGFSLSLIHSPSLCILFRRTERERDGKSWEEKPPGWPWLNHDRSGAVLEAFAFVDLCRIHVSVADQKGLDKRERSEAWLNGSLIGGEA